MKELRQVKLYTAYDGASCCQSTTDDFSAAPCHQFKMCVTESHTTALSRLVTEAVRINKQNKPLMNRKSGFRVNTVLSLNTLSDVTVC